MKAVAIIPARYASTRLPGKALAQICGKAMVERVWEIAINAKSLAAVYVATDDIRVAAVIEKVGGNVIMTSPDCVSGTDRLIEAAKKIDADVYVNVQGDEPLLESSAIDRLLCAFNDDKTQVASLWREMDAEEAALPQNVKAVMDHEGKALYFSRSPIPYARNKNITPVYACHLGIYAYRKKALLDFATLPPSPLEQMEQLEQLRYLQAGIPIKMLQVGPMGGGVDTAEDLQKVRQIIAARKKEKAVQKLKETRLLVTDVDGVLTDGGLYYGPEGEILKKFNSRDGGAIKELQKYGVTVAILSGRESAALQKRAADLGISNVIMASKDKKKDMLELLKKLDIPASQTAYIGDDYPDLPAFEIAGVSIAAPRATPAVRERADYQVDNELQESVFAHILEIIKKGSI